MAESGVSRAQTNRAIRQEELRKQLSSQKHVEKVVDNIRKIEDLSTPLEVNDIQRLTKANDQRLKLINKYLPDLKATELTGEGGGAVALQEVRRKIVDPRDTDS